MDLCTRVCVFLFMQVRMCACINPQLCLQLFVKDLPLAMARGPPLWRWWLHLPDDNNLRWRFPLIWPRYVETGLASCISRQLATIGCQRSGSSSCGTASVWLQPTPRLIRGGSRVHQWLFCPGQYIVGQPWTPSSRRARPWLRRQRTCRTCCRRVLRV